MFQVLFFLIMLVSTGLPSEDVQMSLRGSSLGVYDQYLRRVYVPTKFMKGVKTVLSIEFTGLKPGEKLFLSGMIFFIWRVRF
jgi:hypothetical protein